MSPDAARQLERFFRSYNLSGQLRVVNAALIEFTVEGPRYRLDHLVLELPQSPAMGGQVVKLAWGEYKGKYRGFRVAY